MKNRAVLGHETVQLVLPSQVGCSPSHPPNATLLAPHDRGTAEWIPAWSHLMSSPHQVPWGDSRVSHGMVPAGCKQKGSFRQEASETVPMIRVATT